MMAVPLFELNGMNRERFAEKLGWIFESSPWVAERAWESRPFSSVGHLYAAMLQVLEEASEAEKLALLRAHPDLAARIKMTNASVKEQQGAGLDRLEPEEFEAFTFYNGKYTGRFGFPFILAVRGHNKTTILEALRKRLNNGKEVEWRTALLQVARIAQFRLYDTVTDTGEELVNG